VTNSSLVRFKLATVFPPLRLMRSSIGLRQPISSSTVMDSTSSNVSIDVTIYSKLCGSARRNHCTTSSSLYS
jgi:hypothetical protein